MMLHSSDRAMFRLLGLLALSSICSAMLIPVTTDFPDGEPPETEPDWPPAPRSIYPSWPPDANMTDIPQPVRMLEDMDSYGPPMPDKSICEELMNHQYPPLMEQVPFYCICSYCKGTMGSKGDRGDRGPPGMPGSPGKKGLMGFKGPRGYTGAQGIKGQKGDFGDKGAAGPIGFTGMKGSRGFKGEKGNPGMEGPTGAQGPQGETGTCPDSCETIQGPEGPQGVPGPAGGRGPSGVKGAEGPKGSKGTKGDMGRPGEAGVDGPKGDHGEKGVCDCTDGVDGSDGRPGEKGDKGAEGAPGAKGEQGPVGPKGSEGMIGHMGPPGPCTPTIRSAFSASLNQSYPEQGNPVPFPIVIYNEQEHFNPIKGIYTVPVNGTYLISFHLSVYKRTLTVGLFVDYQIILIATEASQQSTTSQSIVLRLSRGNRVWLQVKDGTTNGMFTTFESRSTFSGYLLFPDSCEWPVLRDHWEPMPTMETKSYRWPSENDP